MTRLPTIFILLLFAAYIGCSRDRTARIGIEADGRGTSAGESVPAEPPRPGICEPTERAPGQATEDEPPAGHAGIVSVIYSSRPEGGTAERFVYSNGHVGGYHQSGAPERPMMSVEHGRVSQACVRAVWTVAERIMPTARQPPPSQDRGTMSISIRTGPAQSVAVSWPFQTEPTDPDVRLLCRLLGEMRIGHW